MGWVERRTSQWLIDCHHTTFSAHQHNVQACHHRQIKWRGFRRACAQFHLQRRGRKGGCDRTHVSFVQKLFDQAFIWHGHQTNTPRASLHLTKFEVAEVINRAALLSASIAKQCQLPRGGSPPIGRMGGQHDDKANQTGQLSHCGGRRRCSTVVSHPAEAQQATAPTALAGQGTTQTYTGQDFKLGNGAHTALNLHADLLCQRRHGSCRG